VLLFLLILLVVGKFRKEEFVGVTRDELVGDVERRMFSFRITLPVSSSESPVREFTDLIFMVESCESDER
jgi:hypothetical protein